MARRTDKKQVNNKTGWDNNNPYKRRRKKKTFWKDIKQTFTCKILRILAAINWNDNFHKKKCDIFLFVFAQNIDRGYTLEPPQWGGSKVYPRSLFWRKIRKKKKKKKKLKITIFTAAKHYTIIDYWGIGYDVILTREYQYWPRRSRGQYWYSLVNITSYPMPQ